MIIVHVFQCDRVKALKDCIFMETLRTSVRGLHTPPSTRVPANRMVKHFGEVGWSAYPPWRGAVGQNCVEAAWQYMPLLIINSELSGPAEGYTPHVSAPSVGKAIVMSFITVEIDTSLLH